MKRIFGFVSIVALMGALGCTTTSGPTNYQADSPPPLVKADAKPKQRAALPPTTELNRRVSANEINEGNALDQARRLEANMTRERATAMVPAERE